MRMFLLLLKSVVLVIDQDKWPNEVAPGVQLLPSPYDEFKERDILTIIIS